MKKGDEETYVYVICHSRNGVMTGPVKVGHARDPDRRVQDLATGNPHKLEVFHAFAFPGRDAACHIEESFHQLFTSVMLNGEWFSMSPALARDQLTLLLKARLAYTSGMSDSDKEKFLTLSISGGRRGKLRRLSEAAA